MMEQAISQPHKTTDDESYHF